MDDLEGRQQISAASLSHQQVVQLLTKALPKHRLRSFEPLTGGMSNLNYLLHVDGIEGGFVLRIYTRDLSACQKEIDLHSLVRERLPVPEVIYADPKGEEGIGPYVLKRYVEGETFQELKSQGNLQDVAEVAYAIGATLARLQTFTFPRPGPIRGGLFSEGSTPISEIIEGYLNSPVLEQRLGAEERDRLRTFFSGWLSQLSSLDQQRSLVHGDFNARNTVVKRSGGRWVVSGVLDWELAFSGSPLWDAARFICFERRPRPLREPYFSTGFREGGASLPENWGEFSRVINAVGATEGLSRADLRLAFVPELKDLIIATLNGRDPS